MKKFLLSAVAMVALMPAVAQTTYNFFDPADCDADGWLWFDSQAKLDKYCGFGSNYKIMLMSTTAEDSQGQFPEPELDGTFVGYNTNQEQGEGSKTGAVILPPATGNSAQNGASIVLYLPDCANFDLYLSSEGRIIPFLSVYMDGWLDENLWSKDMALVKAYTIAWGRFPGMNNGQYMWQNVQDLKNANTDATFAAPAGQKRTVRVTNDSTSPLLIQGIRVFTYTNTNGESAIDAIVADEGLLSLSGKNLVAGSACDMKVYAVDGRLVASAFTSDLDLSGLPAGIYVAKAGGKTLKIRL